MKQNLIRTSAFLLSALTVLPILSCASETPANTETTTAARRTFPNSRLKKKTVTSSTMLFTSAI